MKPLFVFLLPSVGLLSGWFLRPLLSGSHPSAANTDASPAESATAAETGPDPKTGARPAPALTSTTVKAEPLPPIKVGDPAGAIKSLLTFARKSKNPLRTQARILAFADQLSPNDLKTIALEASRQPSNYWGGDGAVKNILLATWAEKSPKEALAYVVSNNTPETRESLFAIFGQLGATDPKAAEAALSSLGEGRKKEALRAMSSRMAEDQPLQALALLDRQKAGLGDFAYYSVFAVWSNSDPQAASSYASSLPDGVKRNQALSQVSRSMALKDPDAAVAWAKSLPRSSESLNLVREVIGTVAERDPQAALALANAQPPREQRMLLSGIAQNWMSSDPDGAVAWIKTLPEGATRQECISNMSWYAAWGGPGDNLNELMALLPKGQNRNQALSRVANYLGYSDPESSLKWAATLSQEDQDLVLARLSGSLADADPKKAAAIAAALPPSANSVEAASRVAAQWAEKNPAEAIAWAATLESEKARQDATAAALTRWADQDPEKAAGASGDIADENARRTARNKIAGAWAQKSPAEAEKWAASLPEADRFSALASVWNATASDDPAKNAASLAAALPQAAGIDAANASLAQSAGTIAKAWVSENPQAAAGWAAQLPEGKARDSAMAAVADQWATTDTMGASTWINQLPQGPSRDEAASKLIEKITPTDPAAAFTWAANIQDPDKQLASLKSTINAWKIYNPAAVRETLANSNLDEATLTKLNAELR
ncbi:MAG: hypothetical protein JWL81_1168 [Verrucomicrobiales bacterium]|nr:hypothetical protein [Verrucomicrobiales bacterium]